MRSFIEENGATCSDDIKMDGDVKWWSPIHWSAGSKMSKAVLDQMYAVGELVIHHKAGSASITTSSKSTSPLTC